MTISSLLGPPNTTAENFTVVSIGANSLEFQWDYYNGSVQNFTVECQAMDQHSISQVTDDTSVFIQSLKEYTTYTCSVRASNLFGMGPTSVTLTIRTRQGGTWHM